ncbi:MAG TPA: hypothetical protein VGK93_08070 [Candidatus Eisenbacteria bacterium]
MNAVTDRALNAAQLAGASYADVRVVESRAQFVEVKNRKVRRRSCRSSAASRPRPPVRPRSERVPWGP